MTPGNFTCSNYVSSCGCTAGNCGCYTYTSTFTNTSSNHKTYEEQLLEAWLSWVEQATVWRERLKWLWTVHARPPICVSAGKAWRNWRAAPRWRRGRWRAKC